MKIRTSTTTGVAEIDNTPMMDVVFILLIFFLVAASFVRESGLPLHSSHNTVPPMTPQLTAVVSVGADGLLQLAGAPVGQAALKNRLLMLLAQNKIEGVSIVAHPRAKTRFVVAAMDAVRSAGVPAPSVRLLNEVDQSAR